MGHCDTDAMVKRNVKRETCQSEYKKVQMDGKNFWLIFGLAKLSRKVKNTANIRLSVNVFG